MTTIEMPGLTVGPMGAWLAAVGVLRAVSRVDPDATLHWDGTIPVLRTSQPAPTRYLADRYAFTPVITPWQSGGGWGAKDASPVRRIDALRHSTTPRLAPMRAAIAAAETVMGHVGDADKAGVVRQLRNRLPDDAIPWLDVAVPVDDQPGAVRAGKPATTVGWAPLAGSGGNFARWDISTNYHAAILGLDPETEPDADGATKSKPVIRRRGLLDDLLDGTEDQQPVEMSGGAWWPSDSDRLNPWALILAVEGVCAFGDRRVREANAHVQAWITADLAAPAVETEPGWGEAWMPMWGEPMTIAEVGVILGGPWPRWRGRRATRAADMFAALRTSGWPAGVDGFARYGLAQRNGQLIIAVPLETLTPSSPPPVLLFADDAAARVGVGAKTWSGYVARGQAPARDDRDPETGRPRWLSSTVDTYVATRPGQGVRTDGGQGLERDV